MKFKELNYIINHNTKVKLIDNNGWNFANYIDGKESIPFFVDNMEVTDIETDSDGVLNIHIDYLHNIGMLKWLADEFNEIYDRIDTCSPLATYQLNDELYDILESHINLYTRAMKNIKDGKFWCDGFEDEV